MATLPEQPLDSSIGWVAEHTRRYMQTAGADGEIWRGAPTLVLITRGRKSGRLRQNALIYATDGDDLLVTASFGGSPAHPDWLLNLRDDPSVYVQVGDQLKEMIARILSPEEKAAAWPKVVAVWPAYEKYQAKTDRDIPVVALS